MAARDGRWVGIGSCAVAAAGVLLLLYLLLELLAALVDPLLDAVAFELLDLVEPLLEVFEDRAEVVAIEFLLAARLQAVHQVANTGHLVTVGFVHPPAEQALKGALEVAVREHVV